MLVTTEPFPEWSGSAFPHQFPEKTPLGSGGDAPGWWLFSPSDIGQPTLLSPSAWLSGFPLDPQETWAQTGSFLRSSSLCFTHWRTGLCSPSEPAILASNCYLMTPGRDLIFGNQFKSLIVSTQAGNSFCLSLNQLRMSQKSAKTSSHLSNQTNY